jgi:hypothetical protein
MLKIIKFGGFSAEILQNEIVIFLSQTYQEIYFDIGDDITALNSLK